MFQDIAKMSLCPQLTYTFIHLQSDSQRDFSCAGTEPFHIRQEKHTLLGQKTKEVTGASRLPVNFFFFSEVERLGPWERESGRPGLESQLRGWIGRVSLGRPLRAVALSSVPWGR